MPVILLPAGFAAFFFIFLGRTSVDAEPRTDWRQAFLQASALCGGAVALSSELLSLFNALTREWVSAFWALFLLGLLLYRPHRRHIASAVGRIRARLAAGQVADPWGLAGMVGLFGLLLLIAIVSPPNNTDSLLYHMPRVAHWIQNASLRHYPTAFDPQLWNAIWAEEAILHLRILFGSDRLSNLVQWASLVGSVVGASAIASLLGAGRKGQFAAGVFAFSLPIALLQATSTQNDLVVAFWFAVFVYFVVLANERGLRAIERVCLWIALGVGILTKSTFYAFGFPFATLYLIRRLRQDGWGASAREASFLAGAVLLFNLGLWARNMVTFGTPLASARLLRSHTNLSSFSPARWLGVLVSNLSLHAATPVDRLTRLVERLVTQFHLWLGVDPGDYRLVSMWNHEDIAGNPLHLALILATLGWLLANRRRAPLKSAIPYALALVAGYLLHAAILSWQLYGSRFQLPFFVGWAPVFGATLSMGFSAGIRRWASRLLLLAALPWVLFNRTRPAVAAPPWTATGSVFVISREQILFASWPTWRQPMEAAVAAVEGAGCGQVGLRIDSHDFEYLVWWLFDAPESGVRIESVYATPASASYADPEHEPCAVICTICGDQERAYGLPLVESSRGTSVYLGDGFRREADGP